MLHPTDFFDISDPFVAELFVGYDYVWQILSDLPSHVARLVGDERAVRGRVMPGAFLSDRPLYIDEGAVIEPGAYIIGPAYIGRGAIVRHGALIRENVILAADSVLGHASEVKHSLFLPQAHAPHFNYIGDSILGWRTNLGAGTKLSNLTLLSQKDPQTGRRPTLELLVSGVKFDTGLAKLGAILGDDTQTGCNVVCNPGCLVGPNTLIYANISLRKGYYPAESIVKLRQTVETVPRH